MTFTLQSLMLQQELIFICQGRRANVWDRELHQWRRDLLWADSAPAPRGPGLPSAKGHMLTQCSSLQRAVFAPCSPTRSALQWERKLESIPPDLELFGFGHKMLWEILAHGKGIDLQEEGDCQVPPTLLQHCGCTQPQDREMVLI